MKKLIIFLICASITLAACTNKTKEKSDFIDIQEAANGMRYEKPQGNIAAQDIPQNLKIDLTNRFPVWRDTVAAAVDVSLKNTSQSHLPARLQARLFVYTHDTKKPMYWSNIDVSFGRSGDQGTMSVISIPVGASNDVIIPIQATKWASVDSNTWPDTPFHTLVPTGKYLMRFEIDIVNEQDQPVATTVSNFIEFETVAAENKM